MTARKLNKRKLTWFTLIGLIVVLFFSSPKDNRSEVAEMLTAESKTDIAPLLDSCVSRERFALLRDSLNKTGILKANRIKGISDGFGGLFLNIRRIEECGTCNFKSPQDSLSSSYFLDLPNYTLSRDASFFIEGDKYYLKKQIYTKVSESVSSSTDSIQQIRVRFSSGLEKFKKPSSALLIPISKIAYQILNGVLWVILALTVLWSLWVLIALPVFTLSRIATGKTFTPANALNLRIIGWTFIFFALAPVLFTLIIHLFFINSIPKEIYYPVWLVINENEGWLIAGIVILMLAEAFKSGYKLKEEQELTI